MRVQLPMLLLAVICMINSHALHADYPIETIELHSRLLDEVVPVIRPLLGEGETVTGLGNQLVIKAAPKRVQEIRKILAELDRPPKRLVILVSNQGTLMDASRGYRASADINLGNGRVGINSPGGPADDSRARIGVRGSNIGNTETVSQQVQALEGRKAWIGSGVQVPVHGSQRFFINGVPHERHATRLHSVRSGFYVVPRLSGDFVTLEILQQHDGPGGAGWAYHTQSAGTRVRGRLGEWIGLGGINTTRDLQAGGPGRASASQSQSTRQIRVKVHLLP